MDPIDPRLLEILACPCPEHSGLEVADDGLRCQFCHTLFEVRDGIPVMLLDEAQPGPAGIGRPAEQ